MMHLENCKFFSKLFKAILTESCGGLCSRILAKVELSSFVNSTILFQYSGALIDTIQEDFTIFL